MSNNTALGATYQGEQHPDITFDSHCQSCGLCKGTEGSAVGGAGPDNLANVRLIVISDHPGYYEMGNGFPFYPNDKERSSARGLPKFLSAGAYIRRVLYRNLGVDSWNETWMTNAVKCNPQHKKDSITIKDSFLKECSRLWLNPELYTLHSYNPNTPVLVLGRHALTAIKYIDPPLKNVLGNSLKKLTREVYYLWDTHPLVFGLNPAAAADAEFRMEVERGYYMKNGIRKIKSIRSFPPLVGSPQWMFEKDLEILKQLL